ncbi:MAG: NUDIX hydrolase [Pseudomonadota bacterium]
MTSRPDIETIDSREVYANNWIRVHEDRVRRRDGSEGIYGVVEKPEFVVVAALADGCLEMVQQYRYPISRRTWELPMGTAGPKGTDALTMAAMELREETGLAADSIQSLGNIYPAPGTMNQLGHVILATGLRTVGPAREIEEQDMVCRSTSVDAVWQMVDDGQIVESNSLAALAILKVKGHI